MGTWAIRSLTRPMRRGLFNVAEGHAGCVARDTYAALLRRGMVDTNGELTAIGRWVVEREIAEARAEIARQKFGRPDVD